MSVPIVQVPVSAGATTITNGLDLVRVDLLYGAGAGTLDIYRGTSTGGDHVIHLEVGGNAGRDWFLHFASLSVRPLHVVTTGSREAILYSAQRPNRAVVHRLTSFPATIVGQNRLERYDVFGTGGFLLLEDGDGNRLHERDHGGNGRFNFHGGAHLPAGSLTVTAASATSAYLYMLA